VAESRKGGRRLYAAVTKQEAQSLPYLYVFVNDNGSIRELHEAERRHLETPYDPTDGARPYVKKSFQDRNALGNPKGYCLRSKIPANAAILEAPAEDPTSITLDRFLKEEIRLAEENGFEAIRNQDGSLSLKRQKK
jgi:hypothetical protein